MAAPTPIFSKGLNDGLQRLYDANKGDVVFICGPLNRNVHSLLLGARSKVFDTMLNSPFQTFQEAHSKRIEPKELDPHLATRMLQHLYGFDYSGHKISIGDCEESSYVSELHTHVQMYALGDKYDIKDLKEEALWKFNHTVAAKKGQPDEATSVVEVIPTIYATTPESDRGLRDVVVAFGAEHLEEITDLPVFKSAAIQVPMYMIEVVPKSFNKLEKKRCCKESCSACGSAGSWDFCRVRCRHCRREQILHDKVDASE